MQANDSPEVLVLDGDSDVALQIAKEVSVDLDAHVIGTGTSRYSRLFYSIYCDESRVLPEPDTTAYASALRSLLEARRPDVVVPVGYQSTTALDTIRDAIPDDVAHPLPPPGALETAVDKTKTLSLASTHGIDVPANCADQIPDDGTVSGDHVGDVFPLFLKARCETGESDTAKVTSREEFDRAYAALTQRNGEPPLVQKYVGGDGYTYAYGFLFVDGVPKLSFGHVELRSVPRWGGSGTRLRAFTDPELESRSRQLLEALDWHGVALVEYRRHAGEYVLMEINPKFWASYALASQSGYRFASTLVAALLDEPTSPSPTPGAIQCERVFPLREMSYCLAHAETESFLEAARAMLWPPAPPDVNLEDFVAWLIPPAETVRDSSLVRAGLDLLDPILDPTPPQEE